MYEDEGDDGKNGGKTDDDSGKRDPSAPDMEDGSRDGKDEEEIDDGSIVVDDVTWNCFLWCWRCSIISCIDETLM